MKLKSNQQGLTGSLPGLLATALLCLLAILFESKAAPRELQTNTAPDTTAPVTVSLPVDILDTTVPPTTVFLKPVTTTHIDASLNYIGFQGDFGFDETICDFSPPFIEQAGLTSGNWNVSGHPLPGPGPIRIFRLSAFSNDFVPLSGSGVLFNLTMIRTGGTPGTSTPLAWRLDPNNLLFVDADLNTHAATQVDGLITITTGAPSPTPTASPIVTPGPATHFTIHTPPDVIQYAPFPVTVIARDQFGKVAIGYTGTVHFTSTDTGSGTQLPANSTLTNGYGHFTATLTTPGYQTITATDTVNSALTGTSDQILVFAHTPTPTPPPTIIVTNTNDSGPGSLRQALADAQNGDTIVFLPSLEGQTITLTSEELLINKDISISGPGANLLSVSRSEKAPVFRIIHIMPGHTVAIQGLTISGGRLDKLGPAGPGAGNGAGILNDQSTLTLDSCTVSSNTNFQSGGGIYNTGTLAVSHSTIINNYGLFGGGGISNTATGTLTITYSAVSTNGAGAPGLVKPSASGAGISNSGTAVINSSTIDHNRADNNLHSTRGGGIYSEGSGSLTVSNSTISENFSAGHGGGIHGGGTFTNCTVSGNTTFENGGGFFVTSTLDIGNTILNAGPVGANIFNFGGTVTSHGYNLSSDNGAGLLTGPGDQINTNPILGPLQNNGGPTFTHELLTNSPAINTGDPNFTPPPFYDQRGPGFDRVFAGRLDIGSFEVQSTPNPTPTPTPTPTLTPTPTATATGTPSPTPSSTPSPARSLNLSTRMLVQTGDSVGIGGFIITGTSPKQVIVRAIGPSLPVTGALADPVIELHGPAGFTTIINDNWRDTQEAEIIATGIPPTDDLESAILTTLDPGAYTAIVAGNGGTTGVALVEIYDLDFNVSSILGTTDSTLANISTRAFVGTGTDVMIGGFILGGGSDTRVIIRGLGPSLAASGVSPVLADPTLELRDGNGNLLASDGNCSLPPPHPAEECIDISLPAGLYTAILAGENGGTGVGLVEIYNVQ